MIRRLRPQGRGPVLSVIGLATALTALLLPGTHAQETQGRIWTVCAEGCDFASIQEAIDLATEGDTVRVMPGSYRENLVIEKAITLEGRPDEEAGKAVTVQPENFEEPTLLIRRPDVLSPLEGVVVRGLVIRSLEMVPGTPPQAGVAVRIEGVGAVLEKNRIVEGIGIRAFALGGTEIVLRDNEIVGSGAMGIQAGGDGRLVVVDNRVEDKFSGMAIGGFLDAEIRGNLVQNNYTGLSLIALGGSGEILAEENQVLFNVVGVELRGSVEVELNRNEIARNVNWGLILHKPACAELFTPEGEFQGTVQGRDNVMYDNGNGNLCPSPEDYPWPEGFVRPPEEGEGD